jgi:hypothetical protein
MRPGEHMKKIISLVAPIVLMFGTFGMANASMLNFDDIALADGARVYLSTYHDLHFINAAAKNPTPTEYSAAGVVSPDNAVYNPYGDPLSIYTNTSTTFDLNSAFFTAQVTTDLQIDAYGYHNGAEVYHDVFTVGRETPFNAVFNWSGVDKVTFAGSGGSYGYSNSALHKYFVMDNFVYNEPMSSVPIPSAILLLGSGLLGLSGVAGRRKFRGQI